jgi:hypothetical protein
MLALVTVLYVFPANPAGDHAAKRRQKMSRGTRVKRRDREHL